MSTLLYIGGTFLFILLFIIWYSTRKADNDVQSSAILTFPGNAIVVLGKIRVSVRITNFNSGGLSLDCIVKKGIRTAEEYVYIRVHDHSPFRILPITKKKCPSSRLMTGYELWGKRDSSKIVTISLRKTRSAA